MAKGPLDPPSGGASPDGVSLAARGGGLNPEEKASGFAVDFGGGKLGEFQKPHVLQVLGNPQMR